MLFDVEGAGKEIVRTECVGGEYEPYCHANEMADSLAVMEQFFAEHPLPTA